MTNDMKYPVRPEIAAAAHVTNSDYQALYKRSIDEPEQFWAEQAESYLAWFQKWDRVMHCDFRSGQIKWFDGGVMREVRSTAFRETWTRYDPEFVERNFLPKTARRLLSS